MGKGLERFSQIGKKFSSVEDLEDRAIIFSS